MANRILAVHLSAAHFGFAAAESSLRSLRVTMLGRVAADSDAIGGILQEHDWDRVVASLPANAAVFRILKFPFHDRRRLGQAVGPALEEHVPMSLDDCTASFDLTGPDRRGTVLAAMAASEQIQAHREALAALGVTAERLIWAPSATLEIYRRAAGADESFTAVDVSEDGATVACLEGGRLLGLRVIQQAEHEVFIRNLAWSLRTLDPPSSRVLIGGSRAMELTTPLAETMAGMHVEQLPFDCPIELAAGAAPGWRDATTVLGLVLAASGDLAAPVIDFASAAARSTEPGELRQAARSLAPWAATTAAALLAAGLLDYARLRQQQTQLEDRADAVYRTVMSERAGEAGKRLKMEFRVAELERRHTELGGSAGYATPLVVLAELSRSVPRELEVEFDTYTYDPPTVRLRGHGTSFETVTRLQQTLQSNTRFSEIAVSDVRTAATGEGVVFEMSIRLEAETHAA